MILSEGLGNFVPLVGGPENAYHLLVPLESLATVEESTVRDMAIASIVKISDQMSDEHILQYLLPLVDRLAKRDWFTSRISACGLFHTLYKRLKDNGKKKEVLVLYESCCKDSTPMVRRSAALYFSKLLEVVSPDLVQSIMYPKFVTLSEDDQDSVKLLAIDNCICLGKMMKDQERNEKILPVVLKLGTDMAWRIRYSVANKMADLCETFGKTITQNKLDELYQNLISDKEAEVRTASCFNITAVCNNLDAEQIMKIYIPIAQKLVTDENEHVRAALASSLMGLSIKLEEKRTLDYLIPLFMTLLKDANSQVRLNILSKLDHVGQVIGVEKLSQTLLPSIKGLAEDQQWRIRLAIIDYIPPLGEQLGEKFFETDLTNICLNWLRDNVFAIREAGISNITRLIKTFGEGWAKIHVIPFLVELLKEKNYLYRLTGLSAIRQLATVVTKDFNHNTLLPMVLGLVTDPIANIRFNISKTVEAMYSYVDKSIIESKIRPVLMNMTSDNDTDVKYFANKALAAIP